MICPVCGSSLKGKKKSVKATEYKNGYTLHTFICKKCNIPYEYKERNGKRINENKGCKHGWYSRRYDHYNKRK